MPSYTLLLFFLHDDEMTETQICFLRFTLFLPSFTSSLSLSSIKKHFSPAFQKWKWMLKYFSVFWHCYVCASFGVAASPFFRGTRTTLDNFLMTLRSTGIVPSNWYLCDENLWNSTYLYHSEAFFGYYMNFSTNNKFLLKGLILMISTSVILKLMNLQNFSEIWLKKQKNCTE